MYNKSGDVSVTVENGRINGRTQPYNNRSTEVEVYLGIPYAEPPVGALRFRRPLPARKWLQPLDAYQWPAPCQQEPLALVYMQNPKPSEDCLYLNVFNAKSSFNNNNRKRAVMVWIHGGGFIMGSSSEDVYNPMLLATQGDVIVVTINYRLGLLGLINVGSDEAPGNMFIWDQIQALEWIQKNIGHFGGDPNRVTVFGGSAGSISISALILSPKSRHLFQNAIMMSGAATVYKSIAEPTDSIRYWLSQAKTLGCSSSSSDKLNQSRSKFTKQLVDCLRQVPADKLAVHPSTPFDSSGKLIPVAVKDGQLLTASGLKMLEKGEHKQNFSLLIGNTGDEGSLLLALLVDPKTFNFFTPKKFTYSEAYDYLKQFSSRLSANRPIDGNKVSKLYFKGLSNKTSSDQLIRTIGQAFGDYVMTCPTTRFGKLLTKNNNTDVNVYQYYYNTKIVDPTKAGLLTKWLGSLCTKWMGACHSTDVLPVFGQPFLMAKKYADREREISAEMMQIFTNFAKTGKPGFMDNQNWPKFYTSLDSSVIAPYYEFSNKPKRLTNYNKNLKNNYCNSLWNRYNN
ncbi:acetylcholinesterase 1-like [Oppia nitens]|uniref:acetylcholinesterase 1-like n=1 Tax=Oppia nitens TaxID=1686743 RepID=UPI0023DC649F|nr:acetylcholinesterase 1-like [Oppia nitens]